jgi:hypothetical protein
VNGSSGLRKTFGTVIDDMDVLNDNWKEGMKLSSISYCTDSQGILVGWWGSIGAKSDEAVRYSLKQFGLKSSFCNNYPLAKDEWVHNITTHFSKAYMTFTMLEVTTNMQTY